MNRSPVNAPAPWSQRRLLVVLAAVTVLLVVAAGTAGYYSLRVILNRGPGGASVLATSDGQMRRDSIAAAPMLNVVPDSMYPATPTAVVAPRFAIPANHGLGPDGVPTGFPHTSEGAVAQLGAIGTRVFSTMSMPLVTSIYRDWAIPGGMGASAWPLTDDVQQFLSGAQAASTMPAGVTISAIPSGAMVKGTDGPDWVLACVLWQISETGGQPVSLGYGFCERMQWVPNPRATDAGRWEIAPGKPAAAAPDTWPGTAIAAQAGWKTWTAPAGGGSR